MTRQGRLKATILFGPHPVKGIHPTREPGEEGLVVHLSYFPYTLNFCFEDLSLCHDAMYPVYDVTVAPGCEAPARALLAVYITL